jgi:hypothetical protein
MNYTFLADLTAVVHVTIIFLVLFGILVSVRYKRFRPIEAAVLLIVIVLWSAYGNCPLIILEDYFRNLAGHPIHLTGVGFIPYYAQKFLHLNISAHTVKASTYTTASVFFLATVEWISPYLNVEIFRLRKSLRKMFRKKKVSYR